MPIVDDLGILGAPPPKRRGIVDDLGILGDQAAAPAEPVADPAAAAPPQVPASLPPPTWGNLGRAALGIFGGGALEDVQGAGRQSGTEFAQTPATLGQWAYENPKQAVSQAVSMAPSALAAYATGGASVPLQLLAQGGAGMVGEAGRALVMGEEPQPRNMLTAGAANMVPIPHDPLGAFTTAGLVSAAETNVRSTMDRGELASPEETAGAFTFGGAPAGLLAMRGGRPTQGGVIDDLGILEPEAPSRVVVGRWDETGRRVVDGEPPTAPPPPPGPDAPPGPPPPRGPASPAGWDFAETKAGPELAPPGNVPVDPALVLRRKIESELQNRGNDPTEATATTILDDPAWMRDRLADVSRGRTPESIAADMASSLPRVPRPPAPAAPPNLAATELQARVDARTILQDRGHDVLDPQIARMLDSETFRSAARAGARGRDLAERIARAVQAGGTDEWGMLAAGIRQQLRQERAAAYPNQAPGSPLPPPSSMGLRQGQNNSLLLSDEHRAEARALFNGESTSPRRASDVPFLQPLIQQHGSGDAPAFINAIIEEGARSSNPAVQRHARQWADTLMSVATRTGRGNLDPSRPAADVIRAADEIFTDFGPATVDIQYVSRTPDQWRRGQHIMFEVTRSRGLSPETLGNRTNIRLATISGRFMSRRDAAAYRTEGMSPDMPLFNIGSAFGLAPATTGPVMLRTIGERIATAMGQDAVAIMSTSRMTGTRGLQRRNRAGQGATLVRPFIIRRRGIRGQTAANAGAAEPPATQGPAAAGPPPPSSPEPAGLEGGTPFPKVHPELGQPRNVLEQMRQPATAEPPPPAAAPPAAPAAAPDGFERAEVVRVPLADIHVDENRFQTRATFGEGGVSGQLRDMRHYDDPSAGNLALWRDPQDGRLFVVDGHNRLNRFRELGVPDARAVILTDPTPEQAAVHGALINMRQGNFNELDVATFLRNSGRTVADLEAAGVPLTNAVNRDGAALANLHPALFGMVARGELPIRRGAILGRELAPGGELTPDVAQAQQLAVAQLALGRERAGRRLSDGELQELIRATRMGPTRTQTQQTLFGEEEITSSLAVERAQIVNALRQRLRGERRLFSTVSQSRAAARLEQEGSRIQTERAREVSDEAGVIDDRLSALANRQGPVADLVTDAARRLSQGDALDRVLTDALPAIRDEIQQSLRGGGHGSPSGGGDEPPPGQGGFNFGNERGAVELPTGLYDFLQRSKQRLGRVGSDAPGRDPGDRRGDDPILRGPSAVDQDTIHPDLRRPVGSLVNRFTTRGQPSGAERQPMGDQRQPNQPNVLLYGPDDRPLILTGRMSAHDPDRLAPSFSGNVDERIAELQQDLGELERARVGYARREVVPVRQTNREARLLRRRVESYADQVGLSPRATIAMLRRRGEAVNAAGLQLIQTYNAEAAVTARAAAARALVDPSEENVRAARAAVALLLDTIPQRAGALAEAGRTLHIAGHPQGAPGAMLRAMRLLEQKAGSAENVDRIVRLLAETDPNDILSINRFVRRAVLSGWRDKTYELWINSLLSGPITQVKNLLSNALNQPIRVGERVIAGGVDWTRAKMTGTERERFVGEALQDVVAMASGFGDAVRAGLRAFKTELPAEGSSNFLDPGVHGQAIRGKVGRAVRLPSRVLLGVDEFFKSITFQGELAAQAYRRAAMEGHVGNDRIRRMNEYLIEPDHDMVKAATTAARYWTFQQQLGRGGRWLMQGRDMLPGASIILPFVRTPINVTKFGLERSPMALAYIAAKVTRGELRGGELSEQIARAAVGTAIAAAVATAFQAGLVTGGGPRDPTKRRAWLLEHQPYSAKVGKKWVSYGQIEPLGSTVGLVADALTVWKMVDQGDAVNKAAATMATSLAMNLGNKTFLQGISDMMDAYSDPERYGSRWIDSLAGTLIPTGAAQLARAIDPTMRKPREAPPLPENWTAADLFKSAGGHMLDVAKTRIPGLRDDTLPIRDLWGEPLASQGLFDGSNDFGAVLARSLSPFSVKHAPEDLASREVARLNAAPDTPDRYLELAREKINLTPEQHDAFVRDSGRRAKEIVNEIVRSDAYAAAPDETRFLMIQRGFEAARGELRGQMKREAVDSGVLERMRAR